MKKIIIGAIALAMLCSSMISCTEETTEVISYDVQTTSQEMIAGSSAIFEASVNDVEVTWKSADATIATVDAGVITAIKEGITTISAINVEEKFKQDFIITVKALPFYCIKTDAGKYSVTAGETCPVLIYKNDLVITSGITFKSTDESVFTIAEGILTGVSKGSAYVEVTVGDQTTKAVVIVTEIAPTVVKTVTLSENNLTLLRGATYKVSTVIYPQNAENAIDGAWSVEKSNVVNISKDGEITALEIGETRVTYTIAGISDYIMVKVTRDALKQFFYQDENTIYSLGVVGKSESKDLVSCKPSINNGAKVLYSIASVIDNNIVKTREVSNEVDAVVKDAFSIDEVTGIVSTLARVKVGSYTVIINAINKVQNADDIILSTNMTIESQNDLELKGVISDGGWQSEFRRGDALPSPMPHFIITSRDGCAIDGLTFIVCAMDPSTYSFYETDQLEGKYDLTYNTDHTEAYIHLKASALNCTDQVVSIIPRSAEEWNCPNNPATDITEEPGDSRIGWMMTISSYLEEVFFSNHGAKIEEHTITNYYVNNKLNSKKGNFAYDVAFNKQCSAKSSLVNMVDNSTGSEITRDEFFRYIKVPHETWLGTVFTYGVASNNEKIIPNGSYTIKVKAEDKVDATKVSILTADLNITVNSENFNWTMLSGVDRIVTSNYTGAIISNDNGVVVGASLSLSDTIHFKFDDQNNIVLNGNINDGVYPLVVTVMDTRNTNGDEIIQTVAISVKVIAAS